MHLRFWNWFSYSTNNYGQVQISVWDGTDWGAWENVGVGAINTSDWSLADINLTAYAGQTVRLAFLHCAYCTRTGCTDASHGWFIDDIEITTTGATNQLPELTLINDQSVNESDVLTIPLSSTDPNLADTLSYSVTAPAFVSLTDNGDWMAELVATPSITDAGPHSITVTVTGLGGLSDHQTFTLTVNNSPQAPSLQPLADQAMNEGDSLVVPIVGSEQKRDGRIRADPAGGDGDHRLSRAVPGGERDSRLPGHRGGEYHAHRGHGAGRYGV
ncbi:MAG: hypothetical protein P8166_10300 [Candidatus Thiodiazotropha sp.]